MSSENNSLHAVSESTGMTMPSNTPAGQARVTALAAAGRIEALPTALVEYRSAGEVLVIGTEEEAALGVARQLGDQVKVAVFITSLSNVVPFAPPTPATASSDSAQDILVLSGPIKQLSGCLGEFSVIVPGGRGRDRDLAEIAGLSGRHFDIVLDLLDSPLIQRELLPVGYFAPAGDEAALARAISEIPGLVGAFEKPQYFQLDTSICAHSRSGLTGCTRCLEACPADAIQSLGDSLSVDPNLCQGAGVCATACPTGAITYRYPRLSDALERVRTLLASYREAGGEGAVLLFHDGEHGKKLVADAISELPEGVIPQEVEEIGSVGMDMWLAALAYGASRVVLLGTDSTPASVLKELDTQIGVAREILEAMGYPGNALSLLPEDWADIVNVISDDAPLIQVEPARFAGMDEKRRVIRAAVEHLYSHAAKPQPLVNLSAGAPFGQVELNAERCTLCMACVSQCPGKALQSGGDTPQLKFLEDNCVQCGLCDRCCPEDAIGPSPRYLFSGEERRRVRVLKEEAPFHCVECGKPFAARGIIERMTERLKDHDMFQGDALRRIQMCEDCRVLDIHQSGGVDVS